MCIRGFRSPSESTPLFFPDDRHQYYFLRQRPHSKALIPKTTRKQAQTQRVITVLQQMIVGNAVRLILSANTVQELLLANTFITVVFELAFLNTVILFLTITINSFTTITALRSLYCVLRFRCLTDTKTSTINKS